MGKRLSKAKTSTEIEPGETEEAQYAASSGEHNIPGSATTTAPQESFEMIYLRQATREFASDLERLRTMSDFRDGCSVQILVDALKQGTACYSAEEKKKLNGR